MLISKKAADILTTKAPLVRVEIANDNLPDNANIQGVSLDCCRVHDVWMRNAHFKECKLRHSRLERVNLRNATIQQVDFTGTHFVECNLAYAEFNGCLLWYCEFERCKINYDSILLNLPPEPNLRQQVLRSLRINASAEGDTNRANDLLLLELDAERRDLYNRFTHASQYYRDKYDRTDQVKAFTAWIFHWLQRLLWGYGVRLKNLLATILVALMTLSTLTYGAGGNYNVSGSEKPRPLRIFESVYVSVITFCTVGYGDIAPADAAGRVCSMITAVVGVIAWGFFVAAVYRRLAR